MFLRVPLCALFESSISQETGTLHRVELSATFTATSPAFQLDRESCAWSLARALARQPWTKQYFARLDSLHQSHYEQFGDVLGQVEVDGELHKLQLQVQPRLLS